MRTQEASCPCGQQSQVLQKTPGRVAWAQAACPAGLRGGSAPRPRWDCQQPVARYGEHLFPHGPFSPFQQYSEQPWRLGEGSSLAEQRVG